MSQFSARQDNGALRKRQGMTAKKRKPAKAKSSGGFGTPDVARAFRGYPPRLRSKLVSLRRLIFRTASKTQGVGPLEETLKWGQPSYLTSATGSGSTIRIDRVKRSDEAYALYFHCQSGLVPLFRDLYGEKFVYEGKRAIILHAGDKPDEQALAHCIALALTHHLRKKVPRK